MDRYPVELISIPCSLGLPDYDLVLLDVLKHITARESGQFKSTLLVEFVGIQRLRLKSQQLTDISALFFIFPQNKPK